MLVVGPKEADAGLVSVRTRGEDRTETMSPEDFLARASKKIADKDVIVAL